MRFRPVALRRLKQTTVAAGSADACATLSWISASARSRSIATSATSYLAGFCCVFAIGNFNSTVATCAVHGHNVLIVDTPWSLPLLMSVCELVYIGGCVLPGDQNYALLSQAALSSCAIIAANSVVAHVQLAQELNNAALTAAEDTANAVRTAGAAACWVCFRVSSKRRHASAAEGLRTLSRGHWHVGLVCCVHGRCA